MNKSIIIGIVAVALFGVGLLIFSGNDAAMQKGEVMQKDNSTMEKKELVVTMKAQNDSGQTGTATLSSMDGKTKIVINIPAGVSGVPQPVHIHMGACPNPGAVAYPLTTVVDGKSETVLDVSLETLYGKLPLAINVHKSKDELKIYSSCGDLSKEGMNSMMKKDDGAMMDKGGAMMKAGSYETYNAEKIAMAASGDVVLFFRASWCPTCRGLDTDIRAHLKDIPASLTILDVNYDDSSALKQKYGVTYQHTFVQVDAQGNQIKKWSGSPTLAALVAEVK